MLLCLLFIWRSSRTEKLCFAEILYSRTGYSQYRLRKEAEPKMTHFITAVNAVIPFLIYITFGYGVKASGLMDEEFARRLNKVIFQAFFPIMMFYNLYQTGEAPMHTGRLIFTGILGEVVLIILLMIIVPRLVKENPRRGVLIQAVYRSNFVLFAVPLTENIFGQAGVTLASVMVTIVVPFYGVMAVIILEYFRGGKLSFLSLVKKVVTNPMILGALVGGVFLVLGIRLPACIEKPVAQFSALTTPLALFVLGGTLQFSSLKSNLRCIVPAVFMKLVLIPAVMVAVSIAVGMEPLERFVLLTMFATPTAAASFPMAQNMGGDGKLAGELVVCSTVASVVTIFLWVFILKSAGLI